MFGFHFSRALACMVPMPASIYGQYEGTILLVDADCINLSPASTKLLKCAMISFKA